MELIAGRFLECAGVTLDLGTGGTVTLRRLPSCDPPDERRWTEACSRLSHLWHQDLPPLLDHGVTEDERFEAYGMLPATRVRRPGANAAVQAFIGQHASPTGTCSRRDIGDSRETIRFGMRLLPLSPLLPLGDILDDGRSASPVSIVCMAEPRAGATTLLQMAAAEGRRRGYVPVAVAALERRPDLWNAVRDRTVLLLCDANDSPRAARRWLLRLATASVRSHVLLRVGSSRQGEDVTLRLGPVPPEALAASVHVYPNRMRADAVRRAAERSGGLPGRFLDLLRGNDCARRAVMRVAEARPAYGAVDDEPAEPELDHPWSDLISNARQQWVDGRRVAAERDLRQIAAAARRRQMAAAAGAAELELAEVLAARGRTSAARELLANCVDACRSAESLSLRNARALAAINVEDGVLEAAESTYRVCRACDREDAAVNLARTLCWQGRYEEAEREATSARDSPDDAVRSAAHVVLARVALARHDLPAAARAADAALSIAGEDDAATTAAAAELLVMVHGRLGDVNSADRVARRALRAARESGRTVIMLGVRATILEAQHQCGRHFDRRRLERLLALAARAPALVRARVWAVAARLHPSEQTRAGYEKRVRAFVQSSGARALLPECAEPAGAALARDVAALLAINESAPTPRDATQRVAAWVRERIDARAVVVCDMDGAALVRSGSADAILAARRVLTTHVAQPPWASGEAIESAVVIRHAGGVRGALACRWPLSRQVTSDVVPVMTAAASVIGPALAELVERAAVQAASPDGIIGRSAAVHQLRDIVNRAARSPFPVVIEGESGAGKELVARAIHRESARRLRACVALNCAALAEELLEAELFGHARGAFTGAHAERAGLFEQADGGTLFLDEVAELSPRAQAKLLRVLEDGEVRRVGENHPRKVDVRVIAASNRLLHIEVEAGRFRRDLLFRLAVIRISVPPLRERTEDIPLLAVHRWQSAAERAGSRAVLTKGALARLARYDWPGNVRELHNVVAALAVHVPRGRVEAEHVSALIDKANEGTAVETGGGMTLDAARRLFERQFVCSTLARCGGRQTDAARRLGISRQGLAKLLKRLEVHPE